MHQDMIILCSLDPRFSAASTLFIFPGLFLISKLYAFSIKKFFDWIIVHAIFAQTPYQIGFHMKYGKENTDNHC